MKKESKIIYVLFCIMIIVGRFHIEYGFSSTTPVINHFLYQFIHASFWHLSGSLLCLFLFYRINIPARYFFIGYIVSVIGSFLIVNPIPTVGFSGCIYAVYGLWLAHQTIFKSMTQSLVIIMLFMLLPISGVNIHLHVFCFSVMFFPYRIYVNIKKLGHDVRRVAR